MPESSILNSFYAFFERIRPPHCKEMYISYEAVLIHCVLHFMLNEGRDYFEWMTYFYFKELSHEYHLSPKKHFVKACCFS